MEMEKIAKKTVDFHKTIFDSSFSAMVTMQDYTEKAFAAEVVKAAWVTEDGRKSVNEMYDYMKKCRDAFKQSIDEGYSKLGDMVSMSSTMQTTAKKPAAKPTASKSTPAAS